MQIRIAKPSDAKQLAELHWICSADQPGGFMFRLGKGFLAAYYQIFLEETSSVVLCAENAEGQIVGLVSGSLAMEQHMSALNRNRLRLAFAALPFLIRHPNLIGSMVARQRSGSADTESGSYIVLTGPREEFWAWLPSERSTGGAIELHRNWLSLMRLLGVSQVKLEVDRVNDRVEKIHRLMGAKVIKEFSTPDGRQRLVMEYLLNA
jgi:hypothetical protein